MTDSQLLALILPHIAALLCLGAYWREYRKRRTDAMMARFWANNYKDRDEVIRKLSKENYDLKKKLKRNNPHDPKTGRFMKVTK